MILSFIITALVIAADQFTKYIIKTNMQIGESFNLVKYVLNIKYIENPGASFGMLSDQRFRLPLMVFSCAALVFMFGMVLYFNKKEIKKYNRLPSIALSFMLGGGLGNMTDRIFNESEIHEGVKVVVDFFEFYFNELFPYVFNVADTFITIGSVLLCISISLGKYKMTGGTKKANEINEASEINEIDETNEIIKEFLEDTGEKNL